VEGPYYFDPKLVRADITEGKPGLRLDLVLKIIDKASCAPMGNVRIDVWHCDAGGVYSGYAGQGDDRGTSTKGQHYLRGTQTTDAKGMVTFKTVYPGWYPGRTPHIHIKALLDEKSVLTGQIYFPDDMSARVYKAHAPYNARPSPDQTNETDFLFRQGQKEGGGIILAMEEGAAGVTGTLLIAVDRSGEAARRAQGFWQRMFGGG
ncbi:MAG: intradiol ring-cleavage dioxygenase, partial [Hyphomicrobiaceae bacterium]